MPSLLPTFTPSPLEEFPARPAITLDPEDIDRLPDILNNSL